MFTEDIIRYEPNFPQDAVDVKGALVSSKNNYHSLWRKLWLKYVKQKDVVLTFSIRRISASECKVT